MITVYAIADALSQITFTNTQMLIMVGLTTALATLVIVVTCE